MYLFIYIIIIINEKLISHCYENLCEKNGLLFEET